jgi:hypothetical protein
MSHEPAPPQGTEAPTCVGVETTHNFVTSNAVDAGLAVSSGFRSQHSRCCVGIFHITTTPRSCQDQGCTSFDFLRLAADFLRVICVPSAAQRKKSLPPNPSAVKLAPLALLRVFQEARISRCPARPGTWPSVAQRGETLPQSRRRVKFGHPHSLLRFVRCSPVSAQRGGTLP